MSCKSEEPKQIQEKLHKEINIGQDENITWKAAYEMAFKCSKNLKLIAFNFKFLHRRLATNTFLEKLGLVHDEVCLFCQSERESLYHLFWECEKTKLFWRNIFSWLQSCKIVSVGDNLQVDVALGLRPDNSNHKSQINYIFLLSKYFI